MAETMQIISAHTIFRSESGLIHYSKFGAASVASSATHQDSSKGGRLGRLGAIYGPMWVVIGLMGGMVGVACCIAVHTAKQQLLHSPSVQVTKKRRECIPEVDSPDAVIRSADKFETKSFLRKIAHIQDNKHTANAPARGAYSRSRECETLKSVGVRN
ncbi:UNVERIFIED_CONTAM: hypothetical protein Sradi_2920300 [Sesamum radiatum]|uniref:Uncharacterized protein n=1 Tax=Sesamum radiatum TaxID=300843 RepID=A0AAW2RZK5_SESRA